MKVCVLNFSGNVGKTTVAAAIARQLTGEGHRVGVYKPVASGAERIDGQLIADDAVRFAELTESWPVDVRNHARHLAAAAFTRRT